MKSAVISLPFNISRSFTGQNSNYRAKCEQHAPIRVGQRWELDAKRIFL